MQAEFQDAVIITRKAGTVLFAMYVRDSYFFVHILLTLKYLSQGQRSYTSSFATEKNSKIWRMCQDANLLSHCHSRKLAVRGNKKQLHRTKCREEFGNIFWLPAQHLILLEGMSAFNEKQICEVREKFYLLLYKKLRRWRKAVTAAVCILEKIMQVCTQVNTLHDVKKCSLVLFWFTLSESALG